MRLITIAACVALALSGPAAAAEKLSTIPKEFRGGWCAPGDNKPYFRPPRGAKMPVDACKTSVMEVTANNYILEEIACRATKIERLSPRRLAISFSCREATTADYPIGAKPSTSYETWDLVGGKLRIRDVEAE
jgi:hypothetical protein